MARDAAPVNNKDTTNTHLRRGRTTLVSSNAPTNGRATTSLADTEVSNQAAASEEEEEEEEAEKEDAEEGVNVEETS